MAVEVKINLPASLRYGKLLNATRKKEENYFFTISSSIFKLCDVEMTRSIVTGRVLNVNMQKNNKNTFTVNILVTCAQSGWYLLK